MENPVRAEVKHVMAYGEGQTARQYDPADPENFGFHAQVFIGQVGDERSDSFDVVVCSPSWFAERVASGDWGRFHGGSLTAMPEAIAAGAGMWFMRQWDSSAFLDALDQICEVDSPGPDWGSVASRIGRHIPWEFAGHYDEAVNRGAQRYPE